MIAFLDIVTYLIELTNAYAFYLVLKTFMPIRRNIILRLAALVCCLGISSIIIYTRDTINILGVLLGFLVYIAVFYKGDIVPKLSIVFILYPMLVSLNFLTENIGMQIYISLFEEDLLVSTAIHMVVLGFRPIAWFAVWHITKRWTANIIALLNTKMWLLLDSVCAAVLASLLVVLNYLPIENTPVAFLVAAAAMITVVGCMYLIVHIANSVQQSAQLQSLQLEYQYYEDKQKDEARVRAIYHDMKNHLLLMQSEHDEGDVQQMIETLQSQLSGYEDYYTTGNSFLDVIIKDKAEKAREHNIDFSAMLRFEDGGFLAPLDISTIFGNVLDNAIEANLKLPVSERMMTVKADRVQEMLTIHVENRMVEMLDESVETKKKDKLLHGFGLANIRKAVGKYDGECVVEGQGMTYKVSIIIPIP